MTNVLLAIVAVLLMANLVRPFVEPGPAFADEKEPVNIELAASGNTAWVLKDESIYYITFETDFDAIKVYRPEKLDR
jgi:hypothetical protein